jgi:glycosyltransferase involved in cell wall biosynthesis
MKQGRAVALVIPGHNCAATVEACLRSVVPLLEQGRLREIVFVNDSSSDDSVARVEQFANVRVVQSPRRGAAAARNAGIAATESELVWFIDADCVSAPDALDLLELQMDRWEAAAVGGSYSNLHPGRLVADLIHEEMVARHEAMGSLVSSAITANFLCRRDVLVALNGFDESLRLAQDLDLAYRIVGAGQRLAFEANSRVGHFHETRLLAYCYKQARQGYWRMHLYARHPTRMTGDTYAGVVDYAQPPLGLLALGGAVGAAALSKLALRRAALLLGVSSAGALCLLQLPRAAQLVHRTGRLRYAGYVPFGMLRALFRGAGMVSGSVAVALGAKR